jgi:hypothetical protein
MNVSTPRGIRGFALRREGTDRRRRAFHLTSSKPWLPKTPGGRIIDRPFDLEQCDETRKPDGMTRSGDGLAL